MTTQITLPPARSVGQPNPPGDMNLVSAALSAMGALSWCFPTTDETGAADVTNVNGAITATGIAVLAPGTFYGLDTVNGTTAQYVLAPFGRATVWKYLGSGDAFRWVDTSTYDSRTSYGGGLLGTFLIDGEGASAGAAGLHYGDIAAGQVEVAVQNFTGTGSMGVHFDNQNYWTEEMRAYVWATNCTAHVVFDVSGEDTSTNSFGYGEYVFEILEKAGQDGVVLQNGAVPYNGSMKIRANFQGSESANTAAVLRITGTVPAGHPNAGGYSALKSMHLDVQAECTDATGSDAPYTIYFGTLSGNTLLGCSGILDFAQGSLAFQASNWTATGAAGTFLFDGPVRGDFNLNNAMVGIGAAYAFTTAGAKGYGKSLLNPANGNTQTADGDYFESALTGDITVDLNPGGAATLGSAQRKFIVLSQPSTGGTYNYTVAWPTSGSPSTTSCTVIWLTPGGTAPIMPTGASAQMVVILDTYDGATWFGRPYSTAVVGKAAPAGFAPSNPVATASTGQVMMGLGSTCAYKPEGSGQVLVTVTATAKTSTAENTVTAGGRYGTGTAPTGSYTATATNASPCVFTAAGSAYANGTEVYLGATSSLPAGFSADTIYYVVDASTDTFSLAATSGGTAINSSSTGSGIYVGTVAQGTRFGPAADPAVEGAGAGAPTAVAITALLNLTPGDTYWFDLAVATGSQADIATIAAVSMTLAELP